MVILAPSHSIAPLCCWGLTHVLSLLCSPVPQEPTQGDHSDQLDQPAISKSRLFINFKQTLYCLLLFTLIYYIFSPHGCWLQFSKLILFPTHSNPPFELLGLSHSLVLVLIPPPQVTVHSPNPLHCPHPPSTGKQQQ